MKTINISSKLAHTTWLRQFPNGIPEWDGWRFLFNDDENHYDYLIVYDDLHAPIVPKCPSENIIHIATEPPSNMIYNKKFLKQFGRILTLGNKNSEHPGAIAHQPGLQWFIGAHQPGEGKAHLAEMMNFQEIELLFDQPKSKLISIIASNTNITAAHRARVRFARKLKTHYGDRLDYYGRGFAPMDDKLDALKDYCLNIVLENAPYEDYFSEKLTDCILAGAYPIYYGCPNLARYFPENSYLTIDINKFDESVAAIDNAIAQQYDKKYRQELREAQQLALYEHNLYPMLVKLIGKIEAGEYGQANSSTFYGEKILPFTPEEFHHLFRPQFSMKQKLKRLANKYPLLNHLRAIYKRLRWWYPQLK